MNGQDYLHAATRLETAEGLDPWTALMRVLVGRLQGMDLPAPLQPALDQAASHWSGHPGVLPELKTEVWRYIEAMGPSGADLTTPEGRTARALLCVLEPDGDDEARSMTAEWFAAMADDQQAAG
ncbi:hypothetical protein [Actinotalea sp. K2]|uniref:hypothetical protein n=1 Tax=Actinotalea sp. K2 TaxID=2939438 RepID=UPI0020170A73|nr:hypothetical protein [Actinotalea sp. K2]MCL3862099.1 hypothetical protein [Actinotalea sp. K2]